MHQRRRVAEMLKFEEVFREAAALNERRMFVLAGWEAADLASRIANLYAKFVGGNVDALYTLLTTSEDTQSYKRLKRFMDGLDGGVSVHAIEYEDTQEVMGTTWPLLILDLTEQLRPNDLGRLVETAAGGGIIILLTPPLSQWPNTTTEFQRRLVTYPYTIRDLKRRFIRRFVRKLYEHRGVWIVDLESGEVHGAPTNSVAAEKTRVSIPDGTLFSQKLYQLAKTQDQVNVLRLLEPMAGTPAGKRTLVVVANRGRGKSAAIGLGLAGIVDEWRHLGRRRRIIVTAPEPTNVQVLFKFLLKGLDALKLDYEVEDSDSAVKVHVGKVTVGYMKPYDVPAKRRDMTVVDEAAGIPVPMLFRILECSDRAVYSSTVHGYEGAGRGFSVRFLKSLEEFENLELETYQMTEPIRYSPTDPIERWLYDVLLLDAEPVELTPEEKAMDVADAAQYYIPDLDHWYGGGGEGELRDFIGIYVLAHYRNRPDDLAMLADAPHHTARAMRLPNGKIVASLQLSREGGLSRRLISKSIREGCRIHGNLIPNVLLRHYFIRRFGRLRGIRVVRIAVHPELMDRGLGSRALMHVCAEAEDEGLDWVGSSFGASEKLLNFWLKNGFVPVHISPERNPTSGEYSVIVVKPLNKRASEVVREMNRLLKLKLVETLPDVYYFMEPEVAALLLSSGDGRSTVHLGRVHRERLRMYVEGRMVYEAAADAIHLLVKKHFLEGGAKTPELPREDTILLVAKCLQGRGWSDAARLLGGGRVMRHLRGVVTKLYERYVIH